MSDFFGLGGEGRVLLWLLIPGFMLIDEKGRRAEWPGLYAAKDQKRRALKLGAIPDDSEIGHNLADQYCQYGHAMWGYSGPPCEKCFPHGLNPPRRPSAALWGAIPGPPLWLDIAVILGVLAAIGLFLLVVLT